MTYRGRVRLADGREVLGSLYPRELAEGRHRHVSAYGGWCAYRAVRDGARRGVRRDDPAPPRRW